MRHERKHTPGPWEWVRGEAYGGGTVKAVHGTNRYICTTSGNVSGNTPLIAAAPEMLEALKEIVATKDIGAPLTLPMFDTARAIIAKVEASA